jgi:hypothetical protein
MKLQRPGYTETTLVFLQYLKSKKINDNFSEQEEDVFINWLYSTSGMYDKKIQGSYFDINTQAVKQSDFYQKWIKEYENAIKNCDFLIPLLHNVKYKETHEIEFIDFLNPKNKENKQYYNYWCNHFVLYPLIDGKKILIISSFAELIKQQLLSGNLNKIFNKFPKIEIESLQFPYTFLNDGPNENSFETLEIIFKEIIKIEFDIAILSCGAYAVLLAERIHNTLRKDVISIGSKITQMFGIDPLKKDKSEGWITEIPEKYIPNYYLKIEGGNYWKK